MNILLVVDKLNWAYHSIAKALVKYNNDPDLHLEIIPAKKNASKIKKIYKKFDRILVMGWQNYQLVTFIPKKITLVGLHSFHSWDNRKTTVEQSVAPPPELLDNLAGFLRVNAVSLRLVNLFKEHGINVTYTPNGVDTSLFCSHNSPFVDNSLIAGYSGSKAHDWRKGVSQFILPAAKKSNIRIKLAMLSTNKYVPLEDMWRFYNKIDCYICASSSEGMSLSVLEALACGRPVIGTKCSGNTEIIKNNVNGFFAERDVNDISVKINKLKDIEMIRRLSKGAIRDAQDNLDWKKRSRAWIDFIKG